MNLRCFLVLLVAGALVLPIVTLVVFGAARLLATMNDAAGAVFLDRTALAGGILWAVDLVLLVVVQGIDSMGPPER